MIFFKKATPLIFSENALEIIQGPILTDKFLKITDADKCMRSKQK